jgi:hypothetical protein
MKTLLHYFDIACPRKEIKIGILNKNKWMNDNILKLKDNMLEQYNNWKTNKNDTNKNRYSQALQTYRSSILDAMYNECIMKEY